MAVTNYLTISGMIVHENRDGVQRDYVPDTLGSTVALVDNTQAITDTWEYYPYGEVSQRTGSNPTPFAFVGTLGYFKDLLDKLFYVRARHLRVDLARWLTVDPLWPDEREFRYARSSPSLLVDSTGLKPNFVIDEDCGKFGSPWSGYPGTAENACNWLIACMKNPKCSADLRACLKSSNCSSSLLGDMIKKCDGSQQVNIWCCKLNCCGCDGNQEALTHKGTFLYNCGINLCPSFGGLSHADQLAVFIHEISHCSGTDDETGEAGQHCFGQDIERCVKQTFGKLPSP